MRWHFGGWFAVLLLLGTVVGARGEAIAPGYDPEVACGSVVVCLPRAEAFEPRRTETHSRGIVDYSTGQEGMARSQASRIDPTVVPIMDGEFGEAHEADLNPLAISGILVGAPLATALLLGCVLALWPKARREAASETPIEIVGRPFRPRSRIPAAPAG